MKKPYKKDYTTIALAQCLISSWKDYKKFEKELINRIEERGFKEKEMEDAESFISDMIIGEEIDDALEFEKQLKNKLKDKKTENGNNKKNR